MNFDKEMEDLREEASKDSYRIPDFMDCKLSDHKRIYREYNSMIVQLYRLIVEKFLTDDEIRFLFNQVEFHTFEISKNRIDNIVLLILYEFEFYMDKYLDHAVEHELYEVIVNIRKFRALYFA